MYIIKEKEHSIFGYIWDPAVLPGDSEIWASVDTREWKVTFQNGVSIRYRDFQEIHQDLGEAMAKETQHELTASFTRTSHEREEPVSDLAEQWAEMGVHVLAEIRRQQAAQ